MGKNIKNKRGFSYKKLLLNILVIACIAIAIWIGYKLFYLHSINAILGSIIFLITAGVLIWAIVVLRTHLYRIQNPSFWLIFLPLLFIVLVLAFAGIQPLSTYKDDVINKTSSLIKHSSQLMPEGTPVATTQGIYVHWEHTNVNGGTLIVELIPTEQTKANFQYTVDLYEKGKFRETRTIMWNQPEINVKTLKQVEFNSTQEEINAYYPLNSNKYSLTYIFNVIVHE